jgi:hypothetical protein
MIILASVDFPQPLSPTMPSAWPRRTASETPCTARNGGGCFASSRLRPVKCFTSSRVSSTGGPVTAALPA